MKILKLFLKSFAGIRDKEISFSSGMNVVLGANDVGKSTIFRAIESALFLPSKVSKSTKEGREILPRVLPIGGDHARVVLDFEARGKRHSLEKIWGQGNSVSFESGGVRLVQEDKVDELVRASLPAPGATFKNVLLMGQGALEGTVTALEENREAMHSLGDFLRVSLNQASGVSVDKLKSLLAAKIEGVFSHWDRLTNLPEKGRGIEAEWKKDLGTILQAYYAKEKLKRSSLLAQELETERDTRLGKLNERQAELNQARAFVRDNEKFVSSASDRQALEAQISKARSESSAMVKDLSAWMQAETDRSSFSPEVTRLSARRAELEDELKAAMANSGRKVLLERFEKSKAARVRLEEARAKLALAPALSLEEFKQFRLAFQDVDRLKNALKSGKLVLNFQVKEELEVTVRKDLDTERKGKMVPGKPMIINAGGRIQLSTDLFELSVMSGDVNTAEIEAELGRASDALGKLRAKLKVENLEEAQDRQEKFAEASQTLKSAEALLTGALAPGEKFEDLERLASTGASSAAARDPQLVQAELQSLLKDLEGKKAGLLRGEVLLADLVRRHGVTDSSLLTGKLVDSKSELSILEKKLSQLPSLPEQVGSLESFLERFRKAQQDSIRLNDEIRTLSVEIAEVKAKLPEQSAQELERSWRDANSAFLRELELGQALLKVEKAVNAVESQSGDIYGGFREKFEKQLAKLSGGKYSKAAMNEGLPTQFLRKDGVEVPYSWLSAGTKDAFTLALRLAMADYFLGSADGFLLIDDPMVNLDPERQKIAAEMLRDFSSTRQVAVFTCHPAHAELLGGNRIQL